MFYTFPSVEIPNPDQHLQSGTCSGPCLIFPPLLTLLLPYWLFSLPQTYQSHVCLGIYLMPFLLLTIFFTQLSSRSHSYAFFFRKPYFQWSVSRLTYLKYQALPSFPPQKLYCHNLLNIILNIYQYLALYIFTSLFCLLPISFIRTWAPWRQFFCVFVLCYNPILRTKSST